MKLSTKLYAATGALALIGTVAAGSGIWYLRLLGEELAAATGKTGIKLDLINATRARSWEMIAALRATFVYASLGNQAEFEAGSRRAQAAYKRSGEQIQELRPLLTTEEGRRGLDRYESALKDFGPVVTEYIRLSRDSGNTGSFSAMVAPTRQYLAVSDEVLNRLKDQQRQFLKDSQARSESLRTQSLVVNVGMAGLLLAIAALVAWAVRGINRTLVNAIGELLEGSRQVAAAAGQVASTSQSLAQGSSEQAASLQETSASSEEIRSSCRTNNENSGAAAGLMAESQQKFRDTNQSLDQMVVAMGEIHTRSDKISKIIKVIDEIAFQTNMMALTN